MKGHWYTLDCNILNQLLEEDLIELGKKLRCKKIWLTKIREELEWEKGKL